MSEMDRALTALRAGKIVLYPTDTLLGLAVLPRSDAVRSLVQVKRRPEGAPMSVGLSSVEEVEEYARLTVRQRCELRSLLPGPYTVLVMPTPLARRRLPPGLFGKRGALGLRVPDHTIARELARRAGPITSTSANLHGRPPCRTVQQARRQFCAKVAVYLTGPPPPSGRPSTIIDLTRSHPHRRPRR
ncbi:MAG: threonylcarbamoyl-AMP synthase [Euryarchaeota archaeon]|nr:threonylcarbamoyl-AMP synthase [Euryarchaeota archaeon]MDE1878953.1 threonylcarbamoyl-AMP synthase [Euryarchaeota archaeon]